MKRSTRPKMFAYVRPCIWLANRLSTLESVVISGTNESPSGRYDVDRSKLLPLIRSASMSQRTALEASMVRAYFSVSLIWIIAFMEFLLISSLHPQLFAAPDMTGCTIEPQVGL